MFTKAIKPTFAANVDIPIPGDTPDAVEFVFSAKTTTSFDALVKQVADREKTIAESVTEIVQGWNHPAVSFSPEKLAECLETYPGAAMAIWTTYRRELFEGKQKN